MKTCCKCKQVQPYSEFNKSKSRKDGFNPQCKICAKQYRLANRSHMLAQKLAHRNKNKDSINQKQREHYYTNKSSILAKQNEYIQHNWEQHLCNKSKENAQNKNLPHTITSNDIVIPNKCPYLEVQLTRTRGEGHVHTNASIDRVDSTKGYTPDNIQITSRLANTMKSNATEAQLIEFAINVLRLHES